jgi:hypothetical protein
MRSLIVLRTPRATRIGALAGRSPSLSNTTGLVTPRVGGRRLTSGPAPISTDPASMFATASTIQTSSTASLVAPAC